MVIFTIPTFFEIEQQMICCYFPSKVYSICDVMSLMNLSKMADGLHVFGFY